MKIHDLEVAYVNTVLERGIIHGQGLTKNYCFLLLRTDEGNFFSEIYSGTYSSQLVQSCIEFIRDKLLKTQSYNSIEQIKTQCHVPFISGNGLYETCVSAIINSLSSHFKKSIASDLSKINYYYSGGTVKSTLDDINKESSYAKTNNYSFYKVRLDYRNQKDCINKIEILNNAKLPYSVDFIVNTNYNTKATNQILPLTALMDPENVVWIEEPFVPSLIFSQTNLIQSLRQQGHNIAIGESCTSLFELQALDNSDLVDFIQLDSTMTSDISNLVKFGNSSSSKIAFHNWGSVATTHQNLIIAAQITGTTHFEIPYYSTPFDQLLSSIKKIDDEDLDYSEGQREAIFSEIVNNKTSAGSNFSWS